MPITGESPQGRIDRAVPLFGTPGQDYVERRAVPVDIAHSAGVRYDADFDGRPAVVVAMKDNEDNLASVHGRYLRVVRGQNKMLTIGSQGGLVTISGGLRADPLILVEGLFDALSLAVSGWASVATIGRWAPWFAHAAAGRVVWLGFDATGPGEEDAILYAERLHASDTRRLKPPRRCKDWNTALVKLGRHVLSDWVSVSLASGGAVNR